MTAKICSLCHRPIPSGAPGGFCPACVLRGADETLSAPPPGGPPLEEVRAAFPQLEVQALIGQGGMGFVYKARQPSLDRTVALKILAPALGGDPAFAERFAREARVLGKLSHPNIVTVFEHGVTQPATPGAQPFYYLLMEYVDGVNLRQAMRAGRFTPEQALSVVPGICDALQAAHAQGIWHRDIKPENILLDTRGGVKIADFGIARLVGDPARDFTITVTGAALGSAVYMAPEQHEKPHDVDHRADIYSLGVVIYEMLTGELPLGRFPAPSQRAAVDARIDEIVLRTLEKERSLRQQSAEEVKTEVAHAATAPPRPAQGQPPVPLLLTFNLAIAAGFVLLISAGFLTYGSTQGVLISFSVVLMVLGLIGAFVYRGKTPQVRISRGVAGAFAALILISAGWVFFEQARQRAAMAAARRAKEAELAVLRARQASRSSPGQSTSETNAASERPHDQANGKDTDSARDWDAALLQAEEQQQEKPDSYWQWPQHMKNGDLARQQGNPAAALQSFELAAAAADLELRARTEGSKKQGKDPGYWPPMRHNWCRWQSRMHAGDMLCELGRLEEAATSYTTAATALDELMVQNKAHPNFAPETVKEALASAFLKLGDVSAARKEEAAAKEYHRSALAVMVLGERKGDKWTLAPGSREFGPDLNKPFDEEELVRRAAKISAEPNDYGSDDWQALRGLLGLACANKSIRFKYLLEDKRVISSQPLSLAALDWSLNRNSKALDFILNSLAKQSVGADCDEPVVLSYVDEWERSAPAVDAHFTQTDGAGSINMGDFWATRQNFFPGNYLRYKYPRLKGAPLKGTAAR